MAQPQDGGTLASTPWPIVHGSPQNLDTSLVNTSVVDSIVDDNIAVHHAPLLPTTAGILGPGTADRSEPVAIVEGSDGTWWTSGLTSVYCMKVRGDGAFRVIDEYKWGVDVRTSLTTDTYHGSYSFVDKRNFFYASFKNTVRRFSLSSSDEIVVEENTNVRLPDDDHFLALNVNDATGHIVLATNGGRVLVSAKSVNCVDAGEFEDLKFRELDLKARLKALGHIDVMVSTLAISNSIGMGAGALGGVALVATAYGVATLNVDAGPPRVQGWWPIEPYKCPHDTKAATRASCDWFMNRLGPKGTGSSPTAFTIGDDVYVAMTDGQVKPMNLLVAKLEADGGLEEVARQPVLFGDSAYSTSEQSVSVRCDGGGGATMVVVNNYVGINSFDLEDPNIAYFSSKATLTTFNAFLESGAAKAQHLLNTGMAQCLFSPAFIGAAGRGVNLYSFTPGAGVTGPLWSNPHVTSLTTIPLQTEERVWVVGNESADADFTEISIMGVDRATGKVAVKRSLATDWGEGFPYLSALMSNIAYAGIGTDGESLVFGTVRGAVRVAMAEA